MIKFTSYVRVASRLSLTEKHQHLQQNQQHFAPLSIAVPASLCGPSLRTQWDGVFSLSQWMNFTNTPEIPVNFRQRELKAALV